MSVKNLKEFMEEYSRKDLFENKKIGLLIKYDEEDNDSEYILNPKKRPNVDLLKMSDSEKKEFNNKFPGIAVNPLYAKPIFWFLPFFKTGITKEKAEKDSYYVEVNDLSHYTTFLFTRSLILMLTWLFGVNTTLLALRSRKEKSREYDFPTNKYCPPYTMFDCSGVNKAKNEEEEKKMAHISGELDETAEIVMGGGGKDKLENLFKLLENNIDNKIQSGGGQRWSVTPATDTVEAGANGTSDIEKIMRLTSDKPPTPPTPQNKDFSVGLEEKDQPGGVNQLRSKPGFGMTLDYSERGRYRITQDTIDEKSGNIRERGFEAGPYAFFSKGPDAASTWMHSGEGGPRFQQFYSYVMRNSTRSVNIIFNTIFKKIGGFIGKSETNYDGVATKMFMVIHVFSIISFFMNQNIILLAPFIIVLAWILKYAFMSKYSGPAAMTVVFDGFFNFGSLLLRNLPIGGCIFGLLFFLIPGVPFFVALITVPLIILFKTWFHVLFGYSFTTKYGRTWIKKMFFVNKLYILFELLLINKIAIDTYYPYDPNSPFLNIFMRDVLAKAAPLGVMLGLIFRDFTNGNGFLTPILFCVISVILTTLICKID